MRGVFIFIIIVAFFSQTIAGEEIIRTKSALRSYHSEYLKAPSHKAFAQSTEGRWIWRSSRTSVEYAIEDALMACNEKLKEGQPRCEIINVNGVWTQDIEGACGYEEVDFTNLQCVVSIYQLVHTEMIETIRHLKRFLNNEEKTELGNAQYRWVSFRNSKCSNSEDDRFYVDFECMKNSTAQRSEMLMDRISECETEKCRPDKF